MLKTSINQDYEHAPRKQRIAELNVAFAQADNAAILAMFADDAVWQIVGGKTYVGTEDISQALQSMGLEPATELVVDNIVTHGNTAAANGVLKFVGMVVNFADFYEFAGSSADAKIKRLTSYGIETKGE